MAKTLDQFNEEARSFVAKAKSKGLSNTGIMNTLKLKYQEFITEQSQQITPYQQAQLDMAQQGSWELIDSDGDGVVDTEFNAQTGVSRPYSQSGTSPVLDYASLNDTRTPSIGGQPDALSSTPQLPSALPGTSPSIDTTSGPGFVAANTDLGKTVYTPPMQPQSATPKVDDPTKRPLNVTPTGSFELKDLFAGPLLTRKEPASVSVSPNPQYIFPYSMGVADTPSGKTLQIRKK